MVALVSESRFRDPGASTAALIARDSYSYLHLPMIAGIVLVALGVKKTIADVDEPLKTIPAVALFGGIALYYAGHVGFRLRNVGSLNRPRPVALIACLALIPLGTEVDALVALGLAAGVTSAVIAYETIAYAEARRAHPARGGLGRGAGGAVRGRRGALLAEALGVEVGCERQEGVDERRVEVVPAQRRELAHHLRQWPGVLVGARREERVEHVADGADPRGERDRRRPRGPSG